MMLSMCVISAEINDPRTAMGHFLAYKISHRLVFSLKFILPSFMSVSSHKSRYLINFFFVAISMVYRDKPFLP